MGSRLKLDSFYKLCSKRHAMKKVSYQTFRTGYGHQTVEIGYFCPKCRILIVTINDTEVQNNWE